MVKSSPAGVMGKKKQMLRTCNTWNMYIAMTKTKVAFSWLCTPLAIANHERSIM